MNQFFYVLNGKKIKRMLLVAAAAVFALGVIYLESDHVTVFSEQAPSAVYSVPTDKKVIALTFDISWGDKRAEPILKVLEDNKVEKATFFLSSPWSKTHPELVSTMKERGYEIGSHGYKHENYSTLTDEDIRKQINTADVMLSEQLGQKPKLIRLPNGDFDKRVLQTAANLGYTVVQWDTDSLDWKNPGAQKIADRVISKAHPGDIVLLHASDSSQQTHEALPVIIDQLRKQGYTFVTVSELINQSTAKGKEVRDQASVQRAIEDAAGL
ncbi:polysaccharide deacetylase family sporulation protein PdaB [Paenibacillus sp. JX-17]|uniref:Polysaccharide deacetylase family sporulation protein PdaB n=1 Tax=Paenibacillus lacisoli TaxID=3064525 RepID=A0ABT9CGB4_9BACL|nr:polysaccharide deacetylase family sporulation protein PdaB [Paenibacillus sp. JX-17]MDO7908312.1 polysaccharide deacetylase family sporulation protein PdaB [Paenibacillus sp. JX-17]